MEGHAFNAKRLMKDDKNVRNQKEGGRPAPPGGDTAKSGFLLYPILGLSEIAVLLQFDVPTFYVSKEFVMAVLRTELPQDMLLDGIPFAFPAFVFMTPKGLIRHPDDGDCPFIALSKHSRGDRHDLTILELSCPTMVPKDMIIASTYKPEATQNVNYFKSVPILPDKTIVECFQEADKTAFSLQLIGRQNFVAAFLFYNPIKYHWRRQILVDRKHCAAKTS